MLYWLNQARMNNQRKRGIGSPNRSIVKRKRLFAFCDWFWTRHYHRTIDLLGGTAHRLVPQKMLAS